MTELVYVPRLERVFWGFESLYPHQLKEDMSEYIVIKDLEFEIKLSDDKKTLVVNGPKKKKSQFFN